METQKKVPGFLTLGMRDIIKGFITAVIGAILTGTMTIINSGNIPTDFPSWKPTLLAGIAAGIAYICKNFLTNSNDEFMKADQKTDQK